MTTYKRLLVVHRRSAYTDLMTDRAGSKLVDLVTRQDPLVEDVAVAHANHAAAMEAVRSVLDKRNLDVVWRHHIEDIAPDTFDLVITIGGDGTVLHASHAIANTPVLAVNSSPTTSVGFLTAAGASDFEHALDSVLRGQFTPARLARMQVEVNDEVVTRRALNDVLFSHVCPASTTRYVISYDGKSEAQLSSGVWVATAAGSTAAIRSAGGRLMPPRSSRLQFVVREAFPRGGIRQRVEPTLTRGFISVGQKLEIRSKTEASRLYVDGPHVVFPVEFGDRVRFSLSDEPLTLFGFREK